jgi:hypothetical protein
VRLETPDESANHLLDFLKISNVFSKTHCFAIATGRLAAFLFLDLEFLADAAHEKDLHGSILAASCTHNSFLTLDDSGLATEMFTHASNLL